jgi:hypothetical protein
MNPLIERVNPITAYTCQSKYEHIVMLLGGIFPAIGISGTFMAGPSKSLGITNQESNVIFAEVGYAAAYVILNANPLLVSFFGIFIWKVK